MNTCRIDLRGTQDIKEKEQCMGMATISAQSVLSCTQVPSPYSAQDRLCASREALRKEQKVTKKKTCSLKVKRNEKFNLKHDVPFYHFKRW